MDRTDDCMNNDHIVRAGSFEIDLLARELRVAGRVCAVEPRVFALIAYLAQRPDRVVTRQELLRGVWPDQRVSDAALARAVMKARQVLGDTGESSPIRTVPRVGYRFVAARAGAPAPDAHAAGRRVAILPIDNATGDPNLDWVGLGLMSLMAEAIDREPGLSTVGVASLLTALDGARAAGADPVLSVKAATGAELVVRGQVARAGAGYRLALECVGQGVVEVAAATPGEIGPAGARALAGLLKPGSERPPAVAHEENPLATTAFARALRAQAQQKPAVAVNLLRMAEMLSPGSTPVRLELLRALCAMGDLAGARPIARALLADAQRRHDGLLTARVHSALALVHMHAQAFEPAIDHLDQSLYWFEQGGPPDEVAQVHLMRAQAACFMGDLSSGELALERMRLPCELSGDRLLFLSSTMLRAYMAGSQGDHERAVELELQATSLAQELHSLRYLAGSNLAADLILIGRWSEAPAQVEQAFAAALLSKDHTNICSAVVSGSWVYMVLGVPAAAERLVDALPPDDELPTLARLWASSARSHVAASAGQHAQAIGFFAQALRQLQVMGNRMNEADVLPWFLRSLVLCGRLDEAEAELAAARTLTSVAARGMLSHCEGLLAHVRGQPERALQSLRRVVDDAGAVPLWRAWAVWDAAWLLAEAGQGAEAQAMLERLPQRFDSLPLASMVAARVHLAMGELGAARRCHGRYLAAASPGLVPRYFERLSDCFAGNGPVPLAPCLPSRL
jgi:DNA-binding winged helix-turn-helix (wHTH) protein/tetratricopeptide (TPR) repeat protein